jgi:CRISPR/Cas system Type II protein with McrA/HNH and RuvC-like nuclease domain
MVPLHSPKDYLFNLYTTSSGEAKRIWRKHIKEQWDQKCAYCNSTENLTIDHIVPQSKGGLDTTKNVVCCCHSCNQSKSHTPWEEWYSSQEFFSAQNYEKIKTWMKPEPSTNLYVYRSRRNNLT